MTQIIEGSVVVVPNKAKLGETDMVTGTVVGIVQTENGREYMVLDPRGYIHIALTREAYLAQE